jgi:anti-sigma28 factor (negative regulator of flagellin synthesis)
MPKPGRRWSLGVRAKTKARPARITKASSTSFFQQGRRLEPHAKDVPEIRHELVARIRREINSGAYDTPAMLDAALERMFARLADC